jgi:hypothetical protein
MTRRATVEVFEPASTQELIVDCVEHLHNTSQGTEERTLSVTSKRERRRPLLGNRGNALLPLLGSGLYIIVYMYASPNVSFVFASFFYVVHVVSNESMQVVLPRTSFSV